MPPTDECDLVAGWIGVINPIVNCKAAWWVVRTTCR